MIFTISRSVLTCLFLFTGIVLANDPGGGTPGTGANVTLSETSTHVTLSNGVITSTIRKNNGQVTSYLFKGTQMVLPSKPIYYSMGGGDTFDVPSQTAYSITSQSNDMVDVSFKRTWNPDAGFRYPLDIDLHFVLRRGDTGLYAYAILDHPSHYPAAYLGEWRIVWFLPRDSTTFHFERAYVDELRNWEMPSYHDYQNSSPSGIAEIVKLNTGVMAGKYDGKYTYSARYYDIGTWGHTSKISHKGAWFVIGGHDYFNDGPTHQDLSSSESYILMHFGRNHYGGSGITIADGEPWRKIFGPFLRYCNETTLTTRSGDLLWADAKAQVEAEKSAWPYTWLENPDHPSSSGRGSVTGRLIVNDPLKPAITGAGAMVGLAAPEATHGNWQQQSKGYQYWARADASGNFTIPAVRPGSYTLYAYTTGVVEEFSKTNVLVTAGSNNDQGDLSWTVTNPGTSIAWEIGIPDRTAREFRHGDDYFTPFLWDVYPKEFPNPLVYNVGSGNPATDINYVHSNYPASTPGMTTAWNWDIKFSLPAVPRSGNATLTVAFASSHYARLFLYINGGATAFTRIYPKINGGNALLRQGIHAKYSYVRIPIPVSRLRQGSNTFRFSFAGDNGFSPHVMYDYLSLHLPEFPPPPPDSGRSIVWTGGANASENTWDQGATASFLENNSPTPFGDGDAVTFDDNGSNSTSITVTGTLQPNSVTVGGTKNYSFRGDGELSGTMTLVKSGTSTLTISQRNSWSGSTEVLGGTLSLANDVANSHGLGTSDVILRNGTLRMFSDGNSSNSSSWNLDIPGGSTGTLETDWRCDLRGKLDGSGSFRYRLPSGSVRSSIFGDWSGFSGTIEATAISGNADFRIGADYSWPGIPAASLSLGPGITAYWAGNLNQDASSVVRIGDLSGSATSVLRGGNIGGRQLTYRVGARGGDATFAGTISEQTNGITNLVKQGTGTWSLTGSSNINGNLTVEDGTLVITGSFSQTNGKSASLLGESTLILNGTLTSPTLTIGHDATLRGNGALHGQLANQGNVELAGGGFTVSGNINNSGYFRVKHPATLSIGGAFVNSGVLNLIGSSQTVPAGIVNTGVILTDRAPATIIWTGASGTRWDFQHSVNWQESTTQPTVFFSGDAVVFDDRATENTVEIDGSLSPSSVTVSTSRSYAITGGALTGTGSLLKSGTGALTLASSHGMSGHVEVSGGALVLTDPASWPASSSLIEVSTGATLNLSGINGGVTLGASQTLRGSGTVQGHIGIQGTHDPIGVFHANGSLQYAASARISWALGANSHGTGVFDSIQATSAAFSSGSTLDLVFNEPGSSVNFNDAYWSTSRSWTILTADTLTGTPALGRISADSGGFPPLAIGNFTLGLSGSSIVLHWTPDAVVARWRGKANANWDLSSNNWDRNGVISTFQNGLAALFDDSTDATGVILTDVLSPLTIGFDSSKNYIISGSGRWTGTATLEKRGSGILTIANANSFSGGTVIHSGILVIGHAAALGTGPVTLAGGRWDTGTRTPGNAIYVNADSTIGGGDSGGSHGLQAISGSGVLTLDTVHSFDLEGPLTNFNGTVRLAGTGTVRFFGSNGSAAASFVLGTRPLVARQAGTYHLGSLSGSPGSSLSIGSYTGTVTYSIGANHAPTTHAGNISNGPGTLSLVKTGNGTTTLAGTSSHTGTTTISSGCLKVTGSFGPSAVTVNSNATFDCSGTVSINSLTMHNSATLARPIGPSMGTLHVTGNTTLAGTLGVTPGSGVSFGRFTILTHSGSRNGTLNLTGSFPGTTAHLKYEANAVVLFLDDSDEDGLPDTWEQIHFGGLAESAAGDLDRDGSSNLVEFRLGLDPGDPASAFRASVAGRTLTWPSAEGLRFSILRSTTLASGSWEIIGTRMGGIGSTATFTDQETQDKAFYKVRLEP